MFSIKFVLCQMSLQRDPLNYNYNQLQLAAQLHSPKEVAIHIGHDQAFTIESLLFHEELPQGQQPAFSF